MARRIIAIILCVCMLTCFCAKPVYAMGAEGAIIGGVAAAGVTLTFGQVALIAAAGFGVVYAVTHADEIGAALENALDSAASTITNGQEQLTTWKERACAGLIALGTAPAWIKGVINKWVTDSYEATYNTGGISPVMSLPANQPTQGSIFWGSYPANITYPRDATILRIGVATTTTISGKLYHSLHSYFVAVSDGALTSKSDKLTYKGNTYYYNYASTTLNPSAEKELAGDNLVAYQAITSLPNYNALSIAYPSHYYYEAMIKGWVDGILTPTNDSICPDVTIGGIGNALDEHGIDNVNIPDINVGQSGLLAPDNTGSISANLDDVLSRLEQQELTWKQYMDDVATGTPTVSIPAEGTETGTLEYPLTDTGVSDVPIDTTLPDNPSMTIPEGIEPYTIDLRTFFPFCIPFDIVKFVDTLCAEPEAPCFEWGFPTPDGETKEITIDLSDFDPVAEILRGMELLLFCIGLAFLTRNLIRG